MNLAEGDDHVPKTLTNTEPQRKPKIPDSLSIALKNGGPVVWASCLIMGLANILNGQLIMGLIYLAVEIGVIVFLAVPNGGLYWISMLPSLGWREQQKVFNEKTFVYEYVAGDQSQLILLYGIASLCVVVLLVLVWQSSVRSGYRAAALKKMGEHVPNFKEQLRSLLDENVHMLLMTPPMACLVIFTILPLLYMMSMAFTNYSKEGDHLVLFDWVGLKNFEFFFKSQDAGRVIGNTVAYALTFLAMDNVLAIGLSLMFYCMKSNVCVKVYNTVMILPRFLSMVIISFIVLAMLNVRSGVINQGLVALGLKKVQWYSKPQYWPYILTFVHEWAGVGMGCILYYATLMGVDEGLFEAAMLDGATKWQQAKYITLPMLKTIMVMMFILSVGSIFASDFGLFYQVTQGVPNSLNKVASTFDTYVYAALQGNAPIGKTAAVSTFQSVACCITILLANFIVSKIDSDSAVF